MANTRKSTKRAGQAVKRQARNQIVRSNTRTALRETLTALKAKDVSAVSAAYKFAIRAIAKAASKGGMPKGRAARKVSRLTLLVKKTLPAALTTK